ncbi:MAG: OadG-related small transporter subunit [Bacillota bacterium]
MNAITRSWEILGLGMATIFAVIIIFYAMVKAMLKICRGD